MVYRKAVALLIPVMGFVIACGIGAEMGRRGFTEKQNSPAPVYAKEKEESRRIAVVNLDEGISKNGKRINYAERISRFPGANFEYSSLEAARNGLKSGRYGAYIIIPAAFSENVESINTAPQVSQLEYAVNKSYSGERQYDLLYSVLGYMDSLNNSLSYMYVNSVLKEFHTAQDEAGSIMENDLREKEAIENIRPQDLVALVEIPEIRQEENTVKILDLSGYTAKNTELANEVDEEYMRCVHDVQSQIAALCEGGNALSDVLHGLSGQTEEIHITEDEEGESITGQADVQLSRELKRQSEHAPDRGSIIRQLEKLQEKNEELKRRWEQSERIYDTNLTAELEHIRQQYLTEIQQNLPAFQLENDTQGNLVLTFEGDGQEEVELPSVIISQKEDTGELTYSGSLETFTDYIKERCAQAEGNWEVTEVQGLLYDDEDQPVTDAEGQQRLCSSLADEGIRQADGLRKEVEEAEDLDADKIREIVKTELVEPVEENAENIKEAFSQRYQAEADSVKAYQEQLAAFRPQISDRFVTRAMDELVQNHTMMQEALTRNNLEQKEYADKAAETAKENVEQLKTHIEEVKIRSDEAVEDGLSEAKSLKAETSMVNQTVLEEFSRRLLYTRTGSAENKQVYQFMANPLMTVDQSEKQRTEGVVQDLKQETEKEDSRFPWPAICAAAGMLLLALAVQIIWDVVRRDRRAGRKKYTGGKRI